jgi:hypothetical protein
MLNVDDDSSDFDFWLPYAFDWADLGYAEWIMNVSDAFWPPGAEDEEPDPVAATSGTEAIAPTVQSLSSRLARYGPDGFIPTDDFDDDDETAEDDEMADEETTEDDETGEDDETDGDEEELPYEPGQTLEFINEAGTGFQGTLDRPRRYRLDPEHECILFERVDGRRIESRSTLGASR